MKLILMINLFDFMRELEVYFNCDVVLTNEETLDYLTFIDPDEKFEKIMGKEKKVNLDKVGPYIEWKNGIMIDIKGHDIIESNIDGTSEESIVFYL